MVNIITWPVIRDDGRSDGGDVDNIILYLSLPTSGCTVYYDNGIITEDHPSAVIGSLLAWSTTFEF
eukprot:scaffold13605_cov145-Skeletonema_menzelii.AAC.9